MRITPMDLTEMQAMLKAVIRDASFFMRVSYPDSNYAEEGISPPSNSKVVVKVTAPPGVNIKYKTSKETKDVVSDDIIEIVVPPGADPFSIIFQFNGVDYDPTSGPIGYFTFLDIEFFDNFIQGDILYFSELGSSAGVRILNHNYAQKTFLDSEIEIDTTIGINSLADLKYPLFQETQNVPQIESGFLVQNRLTLGTKQT